MKALFALYHDYNFEARAPELIEILKLLGVTEISLVTYERPCNLPEVNVHLSKKDKLKFFHFVHESIKWIRKEKPDLVLLHDNASAPILAYLVKRHFKGRIIYDSSELYIDKLKAKSMKYLIARIRPYCEKKYLKHADVVIAANEERAEIMQEYFSLREKPLVLDNIHKIEDEYNENDCRKKYSKYSDSDSFLAVYGGGVSVDRRTNELADTVAKLGKDYSLLIAGLGDETEIEKLNDLIKKNESSNVHYLGRLPRAEWRYLTTIAKCSISLFAQDTPNNKYCASGKFYESLLEGTPVIASTNPPLANACKKYGFGVSSNDLAGSLIEMKKNYIRYKESAMLFAKKYDYKARLPLLSKQIKDRLAGLHYD